MPSHERGPSTSEEFEPHAEKQSRLLQRISSNKGITSSSNVVSMLDSSGLVKDYFCG
jgi:hypothetical protein